jgi:oxaloacetate decarboxylase alpha subunit
VKKYVLGYYGSLLAPIDPELRELIIKNGASSIALEPAPIEPMLPDLRERYPDEDIDLLLLRAMFAGTQVDDMKKTVAAGGNPDEVYGAVFALVKALAAKSPTGTQKLVTSELQISLTKGESENVA